MAQHHNKIVISVENLVEVTWLSRYPRRMEITYNRGSEFIGYEFKKYLIEMEYGITAEPSTFGNPMTDAILEWVQLFLRNPVSTCNITQTYID